MKEDPFIEKIKTLSIIGSKAKAPAPHGGTLTVGLTNLTTGETKVLGKKHFAVCPLCGPGQSQSNQKSFSA